MKKQRPAGQEAPNSTPRRGPRSSQISNEEIFQSIEEVFYDQEFDPLDDILQNLSDASADDLQKMIAKREDQLSVINAMLYEEVNSHYDRFVQGMVQIRELGYDLESAVAQCRNGRTLLRKTDTQLISTPVQIVYNNRRQILYQNVVEHLMRIRDIQDTENQLKQCLSDGEYPEAIQLCQRFVSEVEAQKEFKSVRDLARNGKRYESLVQQKLDASLLEVTRSFTETNFERLLRAYRMSGKLHRVVGKLQQNFTDSVTAGTQDLLYAHVLISEENATKAESLKKLSFAQLAPKLAEEHFMMCLRRIFEYLVELMYSHYQMREWHLRVQRESEAAEEENQYGDLREGLESFSKPVWDAMQKIVVTLLKNANLVNYKIEPFLAVLDAVSKLIEFGEEFSGATATHLQTCILQESRNYFQQYHKKKLEDLRTMVDNERWEAMPVHSGFAPVDIKEIRHFVQPQETEGKALSSLGQNVSSTLLQRHIGDQGDVSALASLGGLGNPFSDKKLSRHDQDSDEEDEELKQDYVVEEGVEEAHEIHTQKAEPEIGTGASVTIVCVNLVRYIGNYLQMMKILQPIAYEVFQGVAQMYQFYLYTVFYFFSSKPTSSTPSIMNQVPSASFTMQSLLKRTTGNTDTEAQDTASFIEDISYPKIRKVFEQMNRNFFVGIDGAPPMISHVPTISSELDIQSSNSMYGLKQRTVALESLEFLSHCMNSVKQQVLQLLPRNYSEECLGFYERYVDIVPVIRDIIMETISERFVNVADLPQQIEKQRWTTTDIEMAHNPYINSLIEEFRMLTVKLQQVVLQGIVSRPEKDFLLKKCICLAMDQLVEGYSRIKKCSAQGRTQMALDVQVFVTALKEAAPTIRPIPKQSHVEMYIKAYFSENILEWIKEHQEEYTGKQLLGLAVCAGNNLNRKDSKDLFKAVDEICARKKN